MNMRLARRHQRRTVLVGLALFFGGTLPSVGSADWTRIPLLPQVNYVQGLKAGSEYLFASMRDSSWNSIGLFRTPLENPGTWEYLGLEGYAMRDIVVVGDGDSHILVPGNSETAIFGSTDGGLTWTPRANGIPQGDGRWAASLGSNGGFPGRVYASVIRVSAGGYWIYASSDFGQSWTEWTDGCPDCVATFRFPAIPQDGGPIGYFLLRVQYYSYRYKTTNGGADWTRLEPSYGLTPIDLEISTDRRDLFAPTAFAGFPYWRDDSYHVTGNVFPPFKDCGQIGAEAPVWAPGILFVAGADADTNLTVVSTQDPYAQFAAIQEGLPPDRLDPCYAFDPFHGGAMFQFEAAPHAPYLFLSAPGGHLWMRDMRDIVGVIDQEDADRPRLSLAPPWPNPTSGRVEFRVPEAHGVPITAEILDIQGRSLHRWTPIPAGAEGVFTWDSHGSEGRSVPTGIYYLKVETRGTTATRTFTIIR